MCIAGLTGLTTHTHTHIHTHTHTHTDRQTDKRTDRQTDRQTDMGSQGRRAGDETIKKGSEAQQWGGGMPACIDPLHGYSGWVPGAAARRHALAHR